MPELGMDDGRWTMDDGRWKMEYPIVGRAVPCPDDLGRNFLGWGILFFVDLAYFRFGRDQSRLYE